jgi:hypothetical protein
MPFLPQSADCAAEAGAEYGIASRAPKAAIVRSDLIGKPPFFEMALQPSNTGRLAKFPALP